MWRFSDGPGKLCGDLATGLESYVEIYRRAWKVMWRFSDGPGKLCGDLATGLESYVEILRNIWKALFNDVFSVP